METSRVDQALLAQKHATLQQMLQQMGAVVVALSGGVDSALLTVLAHQALGEKMVAFTGISPATTAFERNVAIQLTEQFGIAHVLQNTFEMEDANYRQNPKNRCYYCKHELFQQCLTYAQAKGYHIVLEGSNADDLSDHRPGSRAARELEVRAPLQEAKMSKVEIRALAEQLGLTNHDMPNSACLASRFPTGTPIEEEGLRRVERSEELLRSQGFKQVRVRYLQGGRLARVEVGPTEVEGLSPEGMQQKIRRALLNFGFEEVTFDLEGYRTGKLHTLQE